MFICVLKCISYLRVYASFYRRAPIAAWICPRTDSDVAEAILAALKLDINNACNLVLLLLRMLFATLRTGPPLRPSCSVYNLLSPSKPATLYASANVG